MAAKKVLKKVEMLVEYLAGWRGEKLVVSWAVWKAGMLVAKRVETRVGL